MYLVEWKYHLNVLVIRYLLKYPGYINFINNIYYIESAVNLN